MIKAKDYDILIACECSGTVRDAMIRRGLRAISCDLKPTQRPGPHYQGDVRDILHLKWPAMIAHPVCKRLANSGVRWLAERDLWEEMRAGARFFRMFDQANAKEIIGRGATQFVQPWWFGDPFKKATGLWLTGLPPLPREYDLTWYAARKIPVVQEVFLMVPSEDREEKRSKTYPQIARAFAQYWGPLIKALR